MELILPDEAQKLYSEDDVPITKADFYYKFQHRRIYVFVDGPPHSLDHVQEVDRSKRDVLESRSFSVVELDYKDGKYQQDPSLIEKEIIEKLKPFLID